MSRKKKNGKPVAVGDNTAYISKKAAVIFPLVVISFFAISDLARKVILAIENQPTSGFGSLFTWNHFNKALVLLLGYYAVTILTTAFFMFLQQYFYNTDKFFL